LKHSRPLALTAGAALVVAAVAVSAHAQRRPRGPHDFVGPRAFAELNLSETQRDQIRDVRQRHEADLTQARDRVRKARDAHRAAVEALPVDEARIRATSQTLAEAQTEMSVLRARVHGEVWALLTPEQQTRAQELRQQRQERMKERRDRMQKRMEGRRQG
jgi:protein CpxP